jgi:hypothetical protein
MPARLFVVTETPFAVSRKAMCEVGVYGCVRLDNEQSWDEDGNGERRRGGGCVMGVIDAAMPPNDSDSAQERMTTTPAQNKRRSVKPHNASRRVSTGSPNWQRTRLALFG